MHLINTTYKINLKPKTITNLKNTTYQIPHFLFITKAMKSAGKCIYV